MQCFQYAHASATDWQEAVNTCLRQVGVISASVNLGFLYVTDMLAGDVHEILPYLKQETGVSHWVGTVGVGICSQGKEYFDTPALAMMLGSFPENSFRVFGSINEDLSLFTQRHQEWCDAQHPHFAIVHGDPRNNTVAKLVLQLSEHLGEGFLVGGLTSSRTYYLQIADDVVEGGLSGVLFTPTVTVSTRLTQGCSIISARHQITEADDNIVVRIDNRPALDVFKEDIGKTLANDLNKAAGYIFAALPVPGSDTGDYLVRNLLGIDPENKLLAIGEVVKPGMSIMFARRDTQTAHEDLIKMLNNLKRSMKTPPKGGVYYSCLGRGANMFGKDSKELRTIQSMLGDFPLIGFFANGEVSHQRLYGYTGILTVFL